jgi:hypothetical protein
MEAVVKSQMQSQRELQATLQKSWRGERECAGESRAGYTREARAEDGHTRGCRTRRSVTKLRGGGVGVSLPRTFLHGDRLLLLLG